MEEKESEEDGATKEQWSNPEEECGLAAAVVRDKREGIVLEPVRRESEAEGTL